MLTCQTLTEAQNSLKEAEATFLELIATKAPTKDILKQEAVLRNLQEAITKEAVETLQLLWPREVFDYQGELPLGVERSYVSKKVIKLDDWVNTLQVLPNGDIVSGGNDWKIHYHTKQPDGSYVSRAVAKLDAWVLTLQVLPNGDMVSGGDDGKIHYHTKQPDGSYVSQGVITLGNTVFTLQVLPTGDMVSGGGDRKITLHKLQ